MPNMFYRTKFEVQFFSIDPNKLIDRLKFYKTHILIAVVSLYRYIDMTACFLVWCNEGTCVANGTKHTCVCNNGSSNFLNLPEYPCFKTCNFSFWVIFWVYVTLFEYWIINKQFDKNKIKLMIGLSYIFGCR